MFELRFSRVSRLVSRRFTIAAPFHASATSFPFPFAFLYLSGRKRRSSSSSIVIGGSRPTSCGFDKNSSAIPVPAFKHREKVVGKWFRKENKRRNSFDRKTRLYFPFGAVYPEIGRGSLGIRSENGEFKKFRKLGSYTAKKDFDRLAKEWDGKERTPVSPLFQLVLFVWKRCGCAYRCQYTRGGLCTRRRSIIDGTKSWNLFTV